MVFSTQLPRSQTPPHPTRPFRFSKRPALQRASLTTASLLCLLLPALGCSSCRKKTDGNASSATGPSDRFTTVTLTPPGGAPVKVRAELAITPKERNLGLMFRSELGKNEGMLFIFEQPQVLMFWMKNTVIPLDMIFIDENKVVLGVVHRAPPRSLQGRGVGRKLSRYVLEVNGGFAKRHGIVAGTKVTFKLSPSAQRVVNQLNTAPPPSHHHTNEKQPTPYHNPQH